MLFQVAVSGTGKCLDWLILLIEEPAHLTYFSKQRRKVAYVLIIMFLFLVVLSGSVAVMCCQIASNSKPRAGTLCFLVTFLSDPFPTLLAAVATTFLL